MEGQCSCWFVGKTLRDIGLRARFGPTTIAIKHQSKDRAAQSTNFATDDVIQQGDVLSLPGSHDRLENLESTLKRAAER